MKTSKFEQRIIATDTAENKIQRDWPSMIADMPCIRRIGAEKTNVSYGGRYCAKLAKYEIHLADGIQLLTVSQNGNELSFFFFGLPIDESSEECLDYEYEANVIVRTLQGRR